MELKKVIIIGGVAAGMSAASKISRKNPDIQIIVFTDEQHVSYSGCSLPYFVEGLIDNPEHMIVRTPDEFRIQGVDVRLGHTAKSVDEKTMIVTLEGPDKNEVTESYDILVVATGASPIVPDIPGTNLPGVFTVKSIPDVQAIRHYLQTAGVKNAVIIGGGFIGIEMTEALHAHGIHTTIVEISPQILSILDEDMAEIIQQYLEKMDITVLTGEQVKQIKGDSCVTSVITNNCSIDAEVVILSTGVMPNTEFLKNTGVELGIRNAVKVDKHMRTNVQNIYAAGDCTEGYHILTGESIYTPLGTVANKQGRIVGENISGSETEYQGSLGSGIFKVLDMEGARTGFSLKEAKDRSIDAWDCKITSLTKAHTYPGAAALTIKIIISSKNNRIIGGQIVGGDGSAKKIDVISTLIQMGATPEDMAKLDLAYAPPYSPVWDSLLVLANKAMSKMHS